MDRLTRQMEVDEVVAGVLACEARAIARGISLVEDGDARLPALSAGIFPHTGAAATIGLTGAPGVGKSTIATARAVRGAGRGQNSARPRARVRRASGGVSRRGPRDRSDVAVHRRRVAR